MYYVPGTLQTVCEWQECLKKWWENINTSTMYLWDKMINKSSLLSQSLTSLAMSLLWPDLRKLTLWEFFAQIELLVPSECAFHCALISSIDALIGASVAKLYIQCYTLCTEMAKHCFEIRHILLHSDCIAMISIYYVDVCSHATCGHAHQWSECVLNGLLTLDNNSAAFLEVCTSLYSYL